MIEEKFYKIILLVIFYSISSHFFRAYGKRSFRRYAKLFREYGGEVSGVNLLSGHILSANLAELVEQVLLFNFYSLFFGIYLYESC